MREADDPMTEVERADTVRLPEARQQGATAPDEAAPRKSMVDGAEPKAAKEPAVRGKNEQTVVRNRPAARQPVDLVGAGDVDRYRDDWRTVQSGFVDDPAGAVRDADALVGRLFDTLTKRINEQRAALSAHRPDGEGEHTEQLRQALRDYRTLFEQLLPTSHS